MKTSELCLDLEFFLPMLNQLFDCGHLMKSTRFKMRTDQISWIMNSKSSQAVVANLISVNREGV